MLTFPLTNSDKITIVCNLVEADLLGMDPEDRERRIDAVIDAAADWQAGLTTGEALKNWLQAEGQFEVALFGCLVAVTPEEFDRLRPRSLPFPEPDIASLN